MQKFLVKKTKIFIAIVVIALSGGAFWFFLFRDTETFKPSALDQRNNQQNISGWQNYANTKYNFSFSHSKELNVSEFAEKGADIVLAGDVFQILISPFDEPFDSAQGKPGPITKERILKDIPDMRINNDKEISVGGESALSFKSKDESGGETLEIWFIRGGNLYQISAPPDFEKQIMEVLSNWRFLN